MQVSHRCWTVAASTTYQSREDTRGAQPAPLCGSRELAGPSTPCPFPSDGLGALVGNQLAINVSVSVCTLGSASLTVCLSFLPVISVLIHL